MSRRLLSLLSIAGAFAVAFAIATYAQGSAAGVGFPPELPVAALAPVSLSDPEKVALNNAIGSFQIDRTGIADASFDQVRKFVVSGGDAMYVVPGDKGVCLVLRQSSACGAPGSTSRMLGLYVADDTTNRVFGGGITQASVSQVTLSLRGVVAQLPVRRGVFVLTPQNGLRQAEDRTSPLESSTK